MQKMNGLLSLIFGCLVYYHSITINAFVHNHQAVMISSTSSSSLSWSARSASAQPSDETITSTSTPSKPKKRALYSFVEARKIARGHGFASRQEFLDYDCAGAYQLPKNADEIWSQDWTSWEDFLGVPLEFLQAREVARKKVGPASQYKVSTEEQYLELMKQKVFDDGDIASRLPYRPNLKYKTKGWISWDDFLQQPQEESNI